MDIARRESLITACIAVRFFVEIKIVFLRAGNPGR